MFVMLPPVRTSSVHERQVTLTTSSTELPIAQTTTLIETGTSIKRRKFQLKGKLGIIFNNNNNFNNNNINNNCNTIITTESLSIESENTETLNTLPVGSTLTTRTFEHINCNCNYNNTTITIFNSSNNNLQKDNYCHYCKDKIDKTNRESNINCNRNRSSSCHSVSSSCSTINNCANSVRSITNCRKRFFIKKSQASNKEKSTQSKENIRLSLDNNSTENNNKKDKKTNQLKSRPSFILGELNNFRKPTNLQALPVATILNDLSPVPGSTKVKNQKGIFSMSHMTPKGLPSDTPDVKAMRYYRLWIYTCNAVLLMAVIIFCGVAGKVLVADYKRLLVTGLNLGQPNFIYAYLALIVQSGFLQLIGCLGALRLSEKLLNAYWLLLLILLIGDALLGVFWIFKFDKIMQELQPILRYRLSTEYTSSSEFSDLWDRLQTESRCCGVLGPQDFTTIAINRSYPTSCCASTDVTEQISVSKRPLASPVVFRSDDLNGPQSKTNLSDIADTAWSHVVSENREEEEKTIPVCKAVFQQGCGDHIATWLRNTADILFVLGYCVIAFLKLCFLGILRYEIKEMIQKIKLLQNEIAAAILEPEIGEQQLTQQATSPNGGVHTEPKVGNRDRERSRMSSGESERESLLIHENPPQHLQHHQQQQQQQHHLQHQFQHQKQRSSSIHLKNKNLYGLDGAHGGGESDSNSNCALIVEDSGAAAVAAAKALNSSSNNYELSEFETRGPTYRPMNAPSVTKI